MRVRIAVSEGPRGEDFELTVEEPSMSYAPDVTNDLHELLDRAVDRIKAAYPQ